MRSTDSSVTEQFGEQIGKLLRGGEVIELVSDLGGGKTTFVRGLARGMGSPDHVASPTFTISREYVAKGPTLCTMVHFDFYRLADAGLMEHELNEVIGDPKIVTVVEWGKIIEHVLPPERLTIKFEPIDGDQRKITMTYPYSLEYLVENL